MADIPLSSALSGSSPRRQIVTLTASNASFPIPSWAQGGKGIVYVTGCGGGSSGEIATTTGARGRGGASGASATNAPLQIPAGVTTLNAVVAAGGAARTGATSLAGNVGGETSVTVGANVLRLGGGFASGNPYPGGQPNAPANIPSSGVSGITGQSSALANGNSGGTGSFSGGFGAGASSPFGIGGAGVAAGPDANTNGANGSGYGSGGAGALWLSGGAATSGAGSPGLLILEFVEGV